MYEPSGRRRSFAVRTTTALTTSPFFTGAPGSASFTDATMMSPIPAYRRPEPPSTRVFRLLDRSATELSLLRRSTLEHRELPLADDRQDPRDLFPHRLDRHRVVELPRHKLETKVEQLFLRLSELRVELVVRQVA